MTKPKENESGAAAQNEAIAKADAVVAEQRESGVVDVVETVQAAPVGGWNEKVEIANLVDPNSTNLPHPRAAAGGGPRTGPKLNVTGSDVPPQNSTTDTPPSNGNVLDAGLVAQGEANDTGKGKKASK